MPTYQYLARDERGHAVTGTLAAPDPERLADQLKRKGYLVTRAREVSEAFSMARWLPMFHGVGDDALVLLTVQLSKMIQVGIPLVTALDTLAQQTEQADLRRAIGEVARSVEAGLSFSEALQRHPGMFSTLMVSLVQAGEVSGRLDDVLKRMAELTKRRAELRQQLQTALTYPAILSVLSVVVIIFLLTGIIPRFMAIFLEAGVSLPGPTRLLYQASLVVRHAWPVLIMIPVAASVSMGYAMRHPRSRRWIDRLILQAPVVGPPVRKTILSRFARTLETLLGSGVPILESLKIAEQTCGNLVIGETVQRMSVNVREGGTLSDPLKASQIFPPMAIQLIQVGESSGTLDYMLGQLADHYDDLVRHELKRATTLVEPMFLLLMGGVVAFIMASVLLPLFRMVNVIR